MILLSTCLVFSGGWGGFFTGLSCFNVQDSQVDDLLCCIYDADIFPADILLGAFID